MALEPSRGRTRQTFSLGHVFLVTTSSGSTMLVRNNSVLWRREECLAAIQTAVVLDGSTLSPQVAEQQMSGAALLGFPARLKLQLNKVYDATTKLPDFLARTRFEFVTLIRSMQKVGQNNMKIIREGERTKAKSRARRFGFDKVAVCLCNGPLGLVILGLDLITSSTMWVVDIGEIFELGVPSFAKLLPIGKEKVALVLSKQNASLIFLIDTVTGRTTKSENTHLTNQSKTAFCFRARALSPQEAELSLPVRVLSAFQLDQNMLHTTARFRLLVQKESGEKFTVDYPQTSDTVLSSASEYVHHFDVEIGTLQIFQVQSSRQDQLLQPLRLVATATFDPTSERVVALATAIPSDKIHSRFTTLGDDSLLLKYDNPHTLLVASVSPSHAADSYHGAQDDREASDIRLHLTLVDTVSAKIIYRGSLESASAPVHAVLIENSIVATYWNSKAKRCELSSVALYEGVIDRYGLTPFAPKQSAAAAAKVQQRKNFSAFSSSLPIAMQKTFVLPRCVTSIQHSVTAKGIANKNVLIGLTSGQVYALDARLISPRRPLVEPSAAERGEGLGVFHPFVQFNPQQAVTHNYALASGPLGIVSAPTRLESSSLVFSFGRLDVQCNRVIPSGGFDLLASDFNHALLSAMLLLLGITVIVLRMIAKRKAVGQVWA